MGIKEPDKRPGLGMTIRKMLGRTSPEEHGMLWVESRMFELRILDTSVQSGFRYGQSVKDFATKYQLNPDELLAMQPDQSFAILAQRKLHRDLAVSIQNSKSSPEKLQETLTAIKADVTRRAKDPSSPSRIHTALVWFERTGFDEAVRAAQEPQR
jgi:hypothetical protein